LASVDNSISYTGFLAGKQSLSSADPFPVVKIGKGVNDPFMKTTKIINESDKAIDKCLNPGFFRSYELDAIFPDDWTLTVEIRDK
jgi:hypothetical protein